MKFFHVYNEECVIGLEKNGLINRDTGLKIQHEFSVPTERKFNSIAKVGGKLHGMIKDGKLPFYVDRIAGGITYHKYDFDKALIDEYTDILGDDFLGFQLHESGSNRRNSDWQRILRVTDGCLGPYDAKKLRELCTRSHAKMPDGTELPAFSQDSPEQYAKMKYALTPKEYIEEMRDLFSRRMEETKGKILPADSYYLATKIQDELGMRSFMPEVGCQIPMMRLAVSLARGVAKSSKKTWGTYYECWREIRDGGKYFYSMPCFNKDSINEWYLTQELHPDDFTSHGKNGGSSRLLQNRIYHYSLMAGADYFSEEWGLNCSYSDMHDFTLSEYGEVKKSFINDALKLRGMKAHIPFAIVLPCDYACVELQDMFEPNDIGMHRGEYMRCKLSDGETKYYGHVEDVLRLFFNRVNTIGNEGHVITNSKFPDVFDIIYADASDETLSNYEYLIDATEDGTLSRSRPAFKTKILDSRDLDELASLVHKLIQKVLPCYVDTSCWLLSKDERGANYLSLFNNEGNERSLEHGDIIHREADLTATVTFKEPTELTLYKEACGSASLQRVDARTWRLTVPAAGFVILKF